MKIAVLAGDIAKEEMRLKSVGCDLGIFWVDSVSELSRITDADAYFDLNFFYDKERISILEDLLPVSVFINSVADTLDKINQPFIRINAWPGFLSRPVYEISVADEIQKKKAATFLGQLKWDYCFVPDVPGMISARILAMIINEAYYILQDEVSTKEEIDIAMKLGTNYPFGPFEWSKKIGLRNINDLLLELSKTDRRYEPSELLKKEAI